MKRTASALWHGTGKDGNGTIKTQSGVLNDTQYSCKSRFEQGIGTNPEELIAAAHAGCFTMKLSFNVSEAGFTPDSIETTAAVSLENGTITTIHLEVSAQVAGLTAEKFEELAQDAKANCPVSKVLSAATITLNAKLEQGSAANS